MKKLILFLSIAASAHANLHVAPPDFGEAVFIDILRNEVEIVYDVSAKKTVAKSKILFRIPREGRPVFDLVPNPQSVRLNGVDTAAPEVQTPDAATTVRVVQTGVEAGVHTLEVTSELSKHVFYLKHNKVESSFQYFDLADRQFLEMYLPANLEYDQYPMELIITLNGAASGHEILTNGKLTRTSDNKFRIETPAYYNASSFYYHLMPKHAYDRRSFNYKSITGKTIPVIMYTNFLPVFGSFSMKSNIRKISGMLGVYERNFGPYAFDSYIMFIDNLLTGGMEYAGATRTAPVSAAHELFHSWFARGVMPANGNAAWLDEAIATWREDGYRQIYKLKWDKVNLAGYSPYKRHTRMIAYGNGSQFLAYLDHRVGGKLKNFLRYFYAKYQKQVVTTELFFEELQSKTGVDLSDTIGRIK